MPGNPKAGETTSKQLVVHDLYILGLLIDNPSLYLNEICQKIQESTGVSVSAPTVCRLIRRHGFTRKKIVQVAKQRCIDYRGAFMADILQYPRVACVAG